jgi:N-acetylmuramoyl-L-alanine amidase
VTPLQRYLLILLAAMCFALCMTGDGPLAGTPASGGQGASSAWKRRIIVDPGHGGYHRGGLGKINGREVSEKQSTIKVAARLEALLMADPRFEVQLTRRSDVYIGLLERTQIASRLDGDLFVSLHCNAVASKAQAARARGFEIWTWNRDGNNSAAGKALARLENDDPGATNSENDNILNRMMVDALESQALESRRLARAVHGSFITHPYFRSNDRGIDSARFKVLEIYDMPAILVEMGFITHPDEVKMLFDAKWQEQYAQLIYQGIVRYYQETDARFPARPGRSTLADSKK